MHFLFLSDQRNTHIIVFRALCMYPLTYSWELPRPVVSGMSRNWVRLWCTFVWVHISVDLYFLGGARRSPQKLCSEKKPAASIARIEAVQKHPRSIHVKSVVFWIAFYATANKGSQGWRFIDTCSKSTDTLSENWHIETSNYNIVTKRNQ